MKGSKNRNYPGVGLEEALRIPRALQNGASGMPVSKLTLAGILDLSPSSSVTRELLIASRAYGLTDGGVNGDRFELTALGAEITSADELTVQAAMRKAVMNIEPFRSFLTAYSGKKIPASPAFREFLIQQAGVSAERAGECMNRLLEDARTAGFIRILKGSEYIELSSDSLTNAVALNDDFEDIGDGALEERLPAPRSSSTGYSTEAASRQDQSEQTTSNSPVAPSTPKKVFIAHGKNRGPLEEIKKVLAQFRVPVAVAVDEPHAGRPISAKVAQLMREECSSAIFIFTKDERFLREGLDGETVEVWRPSENVVYELGAASILYDRRIVILKERGVNFPSDFSDLGYLEFDADQILSQTAKLFSELVSLDVIEVRAKG